MSRLRVVRPTEVEVYNCDGPRCETVCDRAWHPDWPDTSGVPGSGTVSGCGWLGIVDPTGPRDTYGPSDEARLAFCSWRCVANWAYIHACDAGELDCATREAA